MADCQHNNIAGSTPNIDKVVNQFYDNMCVECGELLRLQWVGSRRSNTMPPFRPGRYRALVFDPQRFVKIWTDEAPDIRVRQLLAMGLTRDDIWEIAEATNPIELPKLP